MSRNTNAHFARNPHANVQRSRFDVSNSVKTTANCGYLYPIEWWEILPGDTVEMNTSILTRMQTLITPLMDDLYMDVFFFYVPNRLLWEHWQQFCGENDTPWFDDTEYTVPQIEFDLRKGKDPSSVTAAPKHGTVADYLGIPLNAPGNAGVNDTTTKVNHLPFRAYCRIWNEWFRSENLQNLTAFNTSDSDVVANNTSSAFYGGSLLPINKMRDQYTTCMPNTQRGPEVTIGGTASAPVFTGSANINRDEYETSDGKLQTLKFYGASANGTSTDGWMQLYGYGSSYGEEATTTLAGQYLGSHSGSHDYLAPANLYADISSISNISINELRLAFATQRYYETLARSGSRYIEMLDSIFGVLAPDQRLQRSEFLGANRVHVNINQVIQNSETGSTPLGNLGAYSMTTDTQNSFTKSFVEHGILMACVAYRYDHSYQDGLGKEWFREDFLDYYNPIFKNIGEQPTFNRELFVDGSSTDTEVFGYNEAWAEYRYKNNRVSGEFRSRYATTLDYWHLADDYESLPALSSDWIKENGEVVNRALAVDNSNADQFMMDVYFKCNFTRPLPLYSIPGLNVL